MKRYIKCGRTSPKKQYVREVCEAMGWRMPTFTDSGTEGYICKWGGKSELTREIEHIVENMLLDEYGTTATYNLMTSNRALWYEIVERERELSQDGQVRGAAMRECLATIDEIYDETGIKCKLTRSGKLIIPYCLD